MVVHSSHFNIGSVVPRSHCSAVFDNSIERVQDLRIPFSHILENHKFSSVSQVLGFEEYKLFDFFADEMEIDH